MDSTELQLLLSRLDAQDRLMTVRADAQDAQMTDLHKSMELLHTEAKRTNGRITTLEITNAAAHAIEKSKSKERQRFDGKVTLLVSMAGCLMGGVAASIGHVFGWW